MPERLVRAAGGVLWRRVDGEVEVALVHRPKYDDWSLPKGKLDTGEAWVVGAVREVREETGFSAVPGRTLGESRYRVLDHGRDASKTVRWWAMRAADGAFEPSTEVDALRWVPVRSAAAQAASGHDGGPLTAFLAGPVDTTTVLLLDGEVPPAVVAAYGPARTVPVLASLEELQGDRTVVARAASTSLRRAYGAGSWALSLCAGRVVDVALLD